MKLKKYMCSIVLCSAILFNVPDVIIAETNINSLCLTKDEMTKALEPYQEAIDKINEEYGSSITIQDGNIEEVFYNVKDMSVQEFEQKTENAYLEAINSKHDITLNADATNEGANIPEASPDEDYMIDDTSGIENKFSIIPNVSNASPVMLEDSEVSIDSIVNSQSILFCK